MKEDSGNIPRGDDGDGRPPIAEQLVDFFAICPDLLVILDSQSQLVFANSAVSELLVGQPSLTDGSRLTEFMAEEDVPEFTTALARLFDQSGTTRFRTRLQGKAGNLLVEWSAGVGSRGGEVFAVGRDLTEQRQMVSALKLAEKRAQALFENAAQGIVAVDGEGLIQMANSTMKKLFGYREEELIGEPVEKLIPDRFSRQHVEDRKGFHASPRNRPMGRGLDLTARHKDGRDFPVEISLSHIPAEKEVWSVAFVSDITDRVSTLR